MASRGRIASGRGRREAHILNAVAGPHVASSGFSSRFPMGNFAGDITTVKHRRHTQPPPSGRAGAGRRRRGSAREADDGVRGGEPDGMGMGLTKADVARLQRVGGTQALQFIADVAALGRTGSMQGAGARGATPTAARAMGVRGSIADAVYDFGRPAEPTVTQSPNVASRLYLGGNRLRDPVVSHGSGKNTVPSNPRKSASSNGAREVLQPPAATAAGDGPPSSRAALRDRRRKRAAGHSRTDSADDAAAAATKLSRRTAGLRRLFLSLARGTGSDGGATPAAAVVREPARATVAPAGLFDGLRGVGVPAAAARRLVAAATRAAGRQGQGQEDISYSAFVSALEDSRPRHTSLPLPSRSTDSSNGAPAAQAPRSSSHADRRGDGISSISSMSAAAWHGSGLSRRDRRLRADICDHVCSRFGSSTSRLRSLYLRFCTNRDGSADAASVARGLRDVGVTTANAVAVKALFGVADKERLDYATFARVVDQVDSAPSVPTPYSHGHSAEQLAGDGGERRRAPRSAWVVDAQPPANAAGAATQQAVDQAQEAQQRWADSRGDIAAAGTTSAAAGVGTAHRASPVVGDVGIARAPRVSPPVHDALQQLACRAAETKDLFLRFDRSHDGTIDSREFVAQLAPMGVSLPSHDDRRQFMRLFDPQGRGSIDYNAFAAALKQDSRDSSSGSAARGFKHRRSAESGLDQTRHTRMTAAAPPPLVASSRDEAIAHLQLVDKLTAKRGSVRALFLKLARDDSRGGAVRVADLRASLAHVGIQTTQEQVAAFLGPQAHAGNLDYASFLRLCAPRVPPAVSGPAATSIGGGGVGSDPAASSGPDAGPDDDDDPSRAVQFLRAVVDPFVTQPGKLGATLRAFHDLPPAGKPRLRHAAPACGTRRVHVAAAAPPSPARTSGAAAAQAATPPPSTAVPAGNRAAPSPLHPVQPPPPPAAPPTVCSPARGAAGVGTRALGQQYSTVPAGDVDQRSGSPPPPGHRDGLGLGTGNGGVSGGGAAGLAAHGSTRATRSGNVQEFSQRSGATVVRATPGQRRHTGRRMLATRSNAASSIFTDLQYPDAPTRVGV